MKKRATIIWLVNDDPASTSVETEDIFEAVPKVKFRAFDSLFNARLETKGPDILVVDISAIGNIMSGPHTCYAPLCSFHDKYPGAVIVINSAVSTYFAADVRDLVIEKCADAVVKLVDWSKSAPSESFKAILKELTA